MSDGPSYLAIMINQSKATAIAIDKTKTHDTAIVDPCVRSTGDLVCLRNEIQPKMCSIPKQMNPTKRINNKNPGRNPIEQPSDQSLEKYAEGQGFPGATEYPR